MTETFVWTDPDGTETSLQVERQTQGRFAPPTKFVTDTSPTMPGSLMRSARHESRRIVVPIVIQASTPTLLRDSLRDLNYALDPVRGPGTLTVTGPDGYDRIVNAYLEDGMGLDETLNETTNGKTWQRASLQFFCEEPYWLDATSTSETIGYAATTSTFFPLFPLILTSSSVFGSATINNTGDVQTWPRWTVTGPGSAIYIRNLTSDEMIYLDTTLTAGETITIDTAPGIRTITKNDGTSLFSAMSTDSVLWPLIVGNNRVQLEMSSATASSSIAYSYERRWLSA